MKRRIALILSALMVLGLFAGCGKKNTDKPGGTVGPNQDKPGIEQTEAAGALVLSANAAIQINYGTDGLVLTLEGLNDEGTDLLEAFEEAEGSSCTEVIRKFISGTHARSYLGSISSVVIKQNKDSGNPGTNFFEGLKAAAEDQMKQIESKAELVMIPADQLDSDGNITPVTAKQLVENFLGVEALDGFDGPNKPTEGYYTFAVTYDGMEDVVHVNANTGGVGQGGLDEVTPEETEPEVETRPWETEPEETVPEEGPVTDETN